MSGFNIFLNINEPLVGRDVFALQSLLFSEQNQGSAPPIAFLKWGEVFSCFSEMHTGNSGETWLV